MGLMGTLAKVAIGYAAARGVDKMAGGQGLQGMLGQLTGGQSGGAGAGGLQDMLGSLTGGGTAGATGGGGNPLEALMGGGAGSAGSGGLMGALGGLTGGAGMAGLLAAAGGAGAAASGGVGGLLDQFSGAEASQEEEEAAGLMLRAMIQAAKADGNIDEAEKQQILGLLGDDADASELEFVQAQLAADVDISGLAADTPQGQEGQVYAMSLMGIKVDTGNEAQYLHQLAQALGLSRDTVDDLHRQMGAQPLYG